MTVSAFFAKEPAPASSDVGPSGPLPRLNLSVKISALTPDVHPADPENSIVALKQRLRPILRRATEVGALVNFDMESYKLKDLTLALFKSILEEEEFRRQPAGRHRSPGLPARLRAGPARTHSLGPPGPAPVVRAAREGRLLGLRVHPRPAARLARAGLVAQARERRQLREAHLRPVRQHRHRHPGVRLAQRPLVRPRHRAGGTPQARSPRVRISGALWHGGRTQVGPDPARASRPRVLRRRRPASGMAYLVRRLLENTSNEGFLRAKNTGEATNPNSQSGSARL